MMSKQVSLLIDCAKVRNDQGKQDLMHHGCVSPDDDLLERLPGGALLSVKVGDPHPKCARCGRPLPPGRIIKGDD